MRGEAAKTCKSAGLCQGLGYFGPKTSEVQVFTKVWVILDQTRANVQVNLAVWQIFRIWREMKCIFARPLRVLPDFRQKTCTSACLSTMRASPGSRYGLARCGLLHLRGDNPYFIVETDRSKLTGEPYGTKAKVEESPAICPLSAHKIKYG